jgi:hypothetical protein
MKQFHTVIIHVVLQVIADVSKEPTVSISYPKGEDSVGFSQHQY